MLTPEVCGSSERLPSAAPHGETTEDGEVSLDRVFCNGCCGHSPVVVVDNDVSGGWTPLKLAESIDKFKEESP